MTVHQPGKERACRSLVGLCVLLSSTPVIAQDAPSKTKQPDIYDVKADGKEQIATALAKAKREHKRVLLMFGGNWCKWCHRLHDLFENDKDVAKQLLYEYELVLVDVDDVDGKKHNAEVIEKYGNPIQQGLPVLVVLDDDERQLVTQETGSLERGDAHDPAKVLAFLKKWQAEPVNARRVLAEAKARAAGAGTNVFAYFSAPWCRYCRMMDAYLQHPKVARVIEEGLMPVKIDVERMTAGRTIADKYGADEDAGLPFFAMISPTGKKLADSRGPDGNNVGFPVEPHEIDHFINVMRTHGDFSSETDVVALRNGLTANK